MELSKTKDELNPDFIFNMTNNALLAKIISGEIDAVVLARKEMADRGYDETGTTWIGFKK